MPSEPPETDYKERVKLRSAAVQERYGVVWAYLGNRETPPPMPHFDLEDIPEEQLDVSFLLRECNWLQALEGDIDTCHVGFLHLGGMGPELFEKGSINYYRQLPENLAPKYEALETDYGAMYCAMRPAGENFLPPRRPVRDAVLDGGAFRSDGQDPLARLGTGRRRAQHAGRHLWLRDRR